MTEEERDPNEPKTRSAKAKEALLKRRETDDLRAIIATESGRRFLMRMLDETKVMGLGYTGEALSGAFNDGMRSVGLFMLDLFEEADFDNVQLARRERYEEVKNG